MKISVRFFKKALVALLATFIVLQVGPAFSAPKSLAEMKPTVWRTETSVPIGHYVSQVAVHFGREVEKRTGGKLKLEVFPSGGLGIPLPKTVSAVRDGLMNMGVLLGAFQHGEFPLADVMELPGLVPGDIKVRREICKVLAPYYEKVLPEQYNQVYLGSWQNDARTIALSKRKVSTMNDLKGLKIRTSGPNEVALCRILGVAPVSISAPEVYSAMAAGTIDGCFGADSWFGSAKFWEVTKYVYSMEFDGHQMHWSINKQDFMALPPDVQKIVRESAAHAIEWVWPEVAFEQRAGRKMLMDHGVQYVDITSKDWAHFVEISKPIVDDWGKKGGPVALEMLNATKKVVSDWNKGKK